MLFGVFDHNDATGLPTARQLDERLELTAAYERLGYYAYQLAEHHGTPLGIATPHLMLAAASRLTSTIKLGTLISILPLVPPLRMVEEAATLDQLTKGRLVLGVGRGVSPVETGFHGVPGAEAQPRFGDRRPRLRPVRGEPQLPLDEVQRPDAPRRQLGFLRVRRLGPPLRRRPGRREGLGRRAS